jgi:hypothetical protein
MTEGVEPGDPGKIDLAKQGASIAAVYVVGYLVVTFRLAQYGVTPTTWLRPLYLAAGIWCLLPLALFSAALAFVALQFVEPWIKYSMDVPRKTRIYRYVQGILLSGVCLFSAFGLISSLLAGHLSSPASSGWWKPSSAVTLKLALLALSAVGLTLFAIAPLFSTAQTKEEEEKRVDRDVARFSFHVLVCFGAIALWLKYISYFSVTVYPVIPIALGGGKPQSVVFIIDSTEHSSPVIADNSRTHSIPYKLLLQTENSYVVESPTKGEKAVEFKPESVRGMIVLQE